MTIERYEPRACYSRSCSYLGEMQPDPDGCWCHHSDYLQLKAELDAARTENALLRLSVKLLAKLVSCPECTSPKVVAACERCGHTWEVE